MSKLAGVSIATASRVLTESSHRVAPATRDRVLAAAAELGYSPSALARALVTRRSRIIGVIVGSVVDPYFAEITRGVEDMAGRAGYLTIVCNADRRPDSERDYVTVLRDYSAEGVVFAGSGLADGKEVVELAAAVAQARDHCLHVIALAPRAFPAESICVDNEAASFDVVDYLISLGHRRISFVRGPDGLLSATERLQGFLAALAQHQLEPAAIYSGDFSYEAGQAAVLKALAEPQLPHAIVGANDETAIGVLTALRQADVGVPAAVSVVGIGDTRPARFLELSTVSLPTYDLGALAARRILTSEGSVAATTTILPHRLVPRATTARRSDY